MIVPRPARPGLSRTAAALLLVACLCPALWAGKKTLKSAPQNYKSAPVFTRSSTAELVERHAASGSASASREDAEPEAASRTLVSGPDAQSESEAQRGSRFVSTQHHQTEERAQEYWLQGRVQCWNQSPKTVKYLGLMIVPFDEHHNALKSNRTNVAKLKGPILGGDEEDLKWETQVSSTEMVEVSVAIMAIAFDDGSFWEAPGVELVGFF